MAALTPDKFKIVGFTQEDANRIDRPTISYWQDAWRRQAPTKKYSNLSC